MAEIPEISKLAKQMNETLHSKEVQSIILVQEKCSNISQTEFQKRIIGAKVTTVFHKGKWIITNLDNDEHILLSLGMGADVLYFADEKDLPEKYQIKLAFTDGSGYTARFWWFGKYLLTSGEDLQNEPNTKSIAIDPFDERFSPEYFQSILKGKKTQIKAFMMDQKNVGGIGNMYMHDILFKARLHPQKKISDMTDDEINALYDSILGILNNSREKGTFSLENDFFGQKGNYSADDFLVGYREGKGCPICGEAIVSIKTGSTSTFICPNCQRL